jgi:hypothetical protein
LEELDNITKKLNESFVKSEMRDKAGVDYLTLAKNWGIGIEAAKRARLVTTQRGIRRMIHPSLKNGTRQMTGSYNTADCQSQCSLTQCTQKFPQGKITRQLRYFVLILAL